MKLSEIKNHLAQLQTIGFKLPNGEYVPSHFHVTEIGKVTKDFIDCGGTIRHETATNFQLWEANDYNHRLHPEKLLKIINLSEELLGIQDSEIEVEYQGDTIGKYSLDFDGESLLLTSKSTDCLAKDLCGTPKEKKKLQLAELSSSESCCATAGICC